jgi:hypothetical protein
MLLDSVWSTLVTVSLNKQHFDKLIVIYRTFSVFSVLLVCKCVLYYCHRVTTQLQLNTYLYINVEAKRLAFPLHHM